MRKLFTANLLRLRKDKTLWACAAAVLLCTAVVMLTGAHASAPDAETAYGLDDYFFNLAPVIGLFTATFCSLFLGTEYAEGTIRNKLIIGHTRTNIYLTNLATSFCAAVILDIAWFLGGLTGIFVLGVWKMSALQLAIYLAVLLFTSLAVAAIMACLATCCTNKAVSAVLAIMLYLALLLLASMLYNALQEPEMLSGVVMTTNGMQVTDPTPNASYISGGLRVFYDVLLNLLPTGQCILLANLELAHPVQNIVSSVLLIVAFTCCGIVVFRKKDIK